MEAGSYTREREDVLLDELSEDYDKTWDFSSLLNLINSDDFFRPFSKRILSYLSRLENTDFLPEEAYLFLFNKMKTAGMNPNRNTLKKWFNVRNAPEGDPGPKMGDDGRTAMFEVAFALGLDITETENFFHRVYLDKAFNIRNPEEFVYRSCISSGKSYVETKALIEKLNEKLGYSESSVPSVETVYLRENADSFDDGDEIIEYISDHRDSFIFTSNTALSNTALNEMKRLLDDLTGNVGKEGLAEKEYRNCSSFDPSRNPKEQLSSEGRNVHSVDFVLDMLFKGPTGARKNSDDVTNVKKLFKRKEIANQFPNANTISHPDSSYIIRKDIILLYFYWYWIQDRLGLGRGGYEEFKGELNGILIGCSFGPLYFGNPYDWLFLFCSAYKDSNVNPLEIFRGIFSQIEESDEHDLQ